jgi:hypothetical protein
VSRHIEGRFFLDTIEAGAGRVELQLLGPSDKVPAGDAVAANDALHIVIVSPDGDEMEATVSLGHWVLPDLVRELGERVT